MATFIELHVKGGRSYIDQNDIAAIIPPKVGFSELAPPSDPITLVLSGCGDTLQAFGESVEGLFAPYTFAGKRIPMLDPSKFSRFERAGGWMLVRAGAVASVCMTGQDDEAKSDEKAPLIVTLRGVAKPFRVWGPSLRDFMLWMQREAGRQIGIHWIEERRHAVQPAD
ncbi:MAG: hypothetical protein AB7J28_15455 [Hyphomonadaceae bacterium]